MKATVWYTLAAIIMLFVLCMAAVNVGRYVVRLPHNSLAGETALCGGQPCIMGVTVGGTAWRDVPAVLGDVPYEWGERRVHISVSPAMSVVFFRSVDGEHVGRGRLAVDRARLPVGWVLVWYGEPCGLSYYPRTSSLVVRYPHSLVNIALRGQGFSPHTAIHDIRWQDPAFESDMQPDLCIDNITDGVVNSQWHGFHMRHYTP